MKLKSGASIAQNSAGERFYIPPPWWRVLLSELAQRLTGKRTR